MNPTPLGTYQHIALSDIRPSKTNPRKHFDQAALDELAQSILALGITTPITVRPASTPAFPGEAVSVPYEIVCGERRWRAAHVAGRVDIPCIVEELDDEEAEQIQIVENLQRADLHPLEEADGYRALTQSGLPLAEDIAKQTGKTATHVGRTMKLLQLELAARRLFLANHITLGHALMLARLTAADQDRALRAMVRAQGDYAKQTTLEVIEAREKNIATNDYAKHLRVVEMTEGALRQWITENVLLQLGKAPWSLEDAQLIPEAGACTTCPKRTGSNPALFEDLTVDADVCLDAVCFAAKQKAFVAVTTKVAANAGKPLLNLLAKSGHKPIEFISASTPSGAKMAKLAHGQWVAARLGSCRDVREGILVDEPGRYSEVKAKPGELLTVCANQACKVHKHHVDAPSPKGGKVGSLHASSAASVEKARAAYMAAETPVRAAVVEAILRAPRGSGLLEVRSAVFAQIRNYAEICRRMSWAFEEHPAKWQAEDNAEEVVKEQVEDADLYLLGKIVLIDALAGALEPWEHHYKKRDQDRKKLWGIAELYDVDADAIAELVESERPTPTPPAPAAAKLVKPKLTKTAQATRKKVAAKKFPAKKKFTLTAEQRKNIQVAQAKRFKELRAKAAAKPDGKSRAAGER